MRLAKTARVSESGKRKKGWWAAASDAPAIMQGQAEAGSRKEEGIMIQYCKEKMARDEHARSHQGA